MFTFLLSLWLGGQAGDSKWPDNRCRAGAQAALPRTSEAPPDRRATPLIPRRPCVPEVGQGHHLCSLSPTVGEDSKALSPQTWLWVG